VQPFFKFPRTPHMAGSEVVDDDEIITEDQMNSMIKSYNITNVIVQEKIDGMDINTTCNSLIPNRERNNFQIICLAFWLPSYNFFPIPQNIKIN